jgi:glycyl-tRNA synthetase (class II)
MALSGKDLTYFDEASKAKYTPIVIESSAGMDRTTLTMLVDAYDNETVTDPESGKVTTRVVLRFHPKIAPVQVGVFRLREIRPSSSNARTISNVRCGATFGRNTMRATSVSCIGVRMRSGRRTASWSITNHWPTER